MNDVDVSVVMGVFNGAGSLEETLESVLSQKNCHFEFVVVDDGSSDATAQILDDWAARDDRLRVIHQANAGLTAALVRGCGEARGRFIARQDCGDVSLPGRLERQSRYLDRYPDVAMVACAVRFVGPGGERLFEGVRHSTELQEGLSVLDVHRVKGPPHHGGTMFTRASYRQAGGYRLQFPVAQDIDLWLRLHEIGRCVGEADVGYEARLEAGSISARRRADQFHFAGLAVECARRRRQGLADSDLLSTAAAGFPRPVARRNEKFERAKFLYFIGSCLRETDPSTARTYYWKAFRESPLLVKSLVRIALG